MKILVAEDDLVSRKFLSMFLSPYGECDQVVDGLEAIHAYQIAMKENEPYDLICLDIMMPKVDGVKVLKAIRGLEIQNNIPIENRAKIIMTTALGETQYVQTAFDFGIEGFASKPIDLAKLVDMMEALGITPL